MSAAGPEHVAVMVAEVVGLVRACNPLVVVDATVGTGGHAEALLEATGAHLIGLDRDCGALQVAARRLERFGARASLHRGNFAELSAILDHVGTPAVGAIVADLGMSSFALNDPARGFSFAAEGPLDMRMDDRQPLRAYDLVNEESEDEIARLIQTYGEERHARRIARALVAARRRRPLETTGELRAAIEGVMGGRRHGGINPATRTFQALRIAVNDESANLTALLAAGPARLTAGGRMIVMAYHSLEDRPVKQRFRELAGAAGFALITRRAVRPAAAEIARNRRARSARLRCLEKTLG
ncbi:MAG TPA: 16S rRNA (cytosine(1402)-N(4))-methyltransferase RsmH [Candidatus Binataceae bacterium]|nr:16S rRNA (cytosine(1402)-N(4))-methyltransferase RsmH [Candidatus Binataceae bacterium]